MSPWAQARRGRQARGQHSAWRRQPAWRGAAGCWGSFPEPALWSSRLLWMLGGGPDRVGHTQEPAGSRWPVRQRGGLAASVGPSKPRDPTWQRWRWASLAGGVCSEHFYGLLIVTLPFNSGCHSMSAEPNRLGFMPPNYGAPAVQQ